MGVVMADDYQFRPDLKRKAKFAFETANQNARYSDASKQRNARSLDRIAQRAANVKDKAERHYEKHAPRWTAKEYKKLSAQTAQTPQAKRTFKPKMPFEDGPVFQDKRKSLNEQARVNVRARHQQRLEMISRMQRRMERQLTRGRSRTQ